MDNKIRTNITGVTVNTHTYKNISFSPTLINFFYGKNGTGKSTLAKSFTDGNAQLTWDGDPYPEERIFIYNEDFIQKNVQSYGNIAGVFTISEVNAELKKEADEKTDQKKAKEAEVKVKEQKVKDIGEEQKVADDAYIEEIWNISELYRTAFPKALIYLRDKKRFVKKLEGYHPKLADKEEVEKLYKTVYSTVEKLPCQEYKTVPVTLPDSPLLQKAILSSGDTEFAEFIRTLGSLDWLTRGHRDYHEKAGGRCPYCGEKLRDNFETDLASCYDAQYKQDKNELDRFVKGYADSLNTIAATIKANQANPWKTVRADDYAEKYELFLEKGKNNMALLHQKQNNPSQKVELDDLSALLAEINEIAEKINDEIRSYNNIVADIPNQKKFCSEMIWHWIAYDSQQAIIDHNDQKQKRNDAAAALREEQEKLGEEISELDKEISDLNNQTVNTAKAMEEINKSLRSAGFRGFELQEKPGAKYVYRLVRKEDGREEVVNKDLSEGERHFIAFLYFYHLVMGSQSDDGKQEDKIVIIDDPVSSMDSGSLFVVASLVREMAAVCYNNYELDEENRDDHIRQFFCLTHNPYFFREVTYNRLSDYECTTIFEIKKDTNNKTTIEECEDEDEYAGNRKILRSPVRNNYDMLWREYCLNTDDPETLMIVIRQILEYYFVQMVGYQNSNLRTELLDKNKDEWKDKDERTAASAMISMLNIGATGFNDGLYYDPSAADVAQLKSVFERIFRVMNQESHFNMMTRRK